MRSTRPARRWWLALLLFVPGMAAAQQPIVIQMEQPPSAAPKPTSLLLVIESDGRLLVDGRAVSNAEAQRIFARTLKAQPKLSVQLQPPENVAHARVVEVLDIARAAGIKEFALDVMRLKQPPSTAPAPLAVVIEADGRLFIEGKVASNAEAQRIFAQKRTAHPKVSVLLKVAKQVKYARVIEVIDMTQSAGIKDFTLGALPE
jgi:biopolymer transport protein ExbD